MSAASARVVGNSPELALSGHQRARTVRAERTGAGELQRFLDDPDITDVLVNGVSGVWIDRGHGLQRMATPLTSLGDVRELAVRMAAAGGQRLDDAAPVADARLPGGIRLHAVLPPIAPDGPLISLRIIRRRALSLPELAERGTVTPEVATILHALMLARVSFLLSGATGCGKTTMLASLLSVADDHERIVLVEDIGELAPRHPHVVRLEARRANVEGKGTITLSDLVRQSLRMRPDRIVIGECRGPEIVDLLAALNTGHRGGCGTIHANSTDAVPARLEMLAGQAGLSPEETAHQAVNAIDVVLHLDRNRQARMLSEIAILRCVGSRLSVETALAMGEQGPVYGPAWQRLAALGGATSSGSWANGASE